MNSCNYLYTISFTVGAEAGIALVAAPNERMAMDLLRNSGNHSHAEPGYSLVEMRNIGLTGACAYGLLMESYVNAKEAYDAIIQVVNRIAKGEKGDKGDKGDTGPLLFDTVDASIDGLVEDPSVDCRIENKVLYLSFSGLKGRTGISIADISQTRQSDKDGGLNEITIRLDNGDTSKVYVKNGETGVTGVSASVDSLPGDPRVVTNLNEGALTFSFFGLKGAQGNPGVNNTVMRIVESLPAEASEATAQTVYLLYNSDTGMFDQYITQYNGSSYSFAQAGSLSIDMSDYKRTDSEIWITQEEFDALPVKDITKTYNIYEEDDSIDVGEPEDEGSGASE